MKDRSVMKLEAHESYSSAQLLKPKKKITDYKWQARWILKMC